ncbi:ankyrin repeat domain-containing protein 26 isoform C [Patagioenas fasciata monilis]|uniref:Ankyrin repeat domain-containing protein 26 isoform C n=1 Tax=Patagioenas fasciata monilis TaxID=372326 RepID=A0A1V4JAA4_PATFA|nr:ankyrin repeat domain-containing protein 26 isoform C [Patagioenas fasciata monilis]
MKKIFGFGWKKKGQSPSGGASLPCPAGAYDIQHKELSKLHRAAASGDLAQVRRGLKKFSIDGRDKAARTPLHLACANGHVDVVTYLVESKCKLNLPDSDNRSPLMKAVQCQQEKCVAILLEHGAEPNLPDADGNTALHLSVISPNTTVAELLLDYYANIEARNKEGFTPLALAISEHQEEIVEFLLGHGADVHARDQRERTPLMIAASDGELNLVKVLLRYGADVSHTDPHEWTAEDYAVIHGYSSLSELLAQHADSENTGEASAGAAAGLPVLSIPPWVGTAGIKLGAPAVDRAIDDSSQGDSVSSEKEEGDDTWHTSEEEELDFTPKKPQKPNLTLLMNASQKFRKKNDGDGSRIESPKLPEKSLREEQEEEDQENEETQSKDIQVEKQGKKTKPKGEINQKLKYFTNAKYEGEAWCGTGDVCDDDHKITEFSSSKGLSFSEKPSNSQLKTPESALEMKETSPKKRQQDPGECSGSTCRMSSSAEKEDIKDAFENDEMQVEKEKSKRRCFKTEVMANQEDLDKLNTPPGNITDEQMKQKVTLRKKDSSKIETGNTAEVKDEKNFSSEKRLKCIKMPMKGKPSLNAKVSKKNKRQASKKKADKQMSSCAGNNFQVLDDSTFSETSQDERRPAAKLGSEKNKVSTQMDVTADRDLARSSDTTSADAELPTSTCKEAMLLLEQLHVDHTSSAILLKLQNILLEYERIIEHEKNRYLAVWREVRKLESEKESSQLRAEETQEWKNDIQSLKCTLKQEEEKRLRVETLYEKTSETLRKKEDQYCKEMEEKQQLELRSRNLEMELITLRKLLKQVEEERDDTRRQLSQEKSARALQEEILNHHLWRQKELEEEARRSIEKNADESDTEREKDLLYKNQLLQDEITRLRVELDQVRFRHQEEEGKYLEENETLKVKTEDLKKELKLNEEALAQTVFQYNGQLSLLKTESAVLNSKLEQTKESKDRLETEIESFRSRLNTTLQELERHQSSKSDVERTLQRERDEWLRLQDRLHRDLSDVQETNQSLSQQLSKAESKANSLENELHQLKQTLREKTLLLEMTQKELSQAQSQAKECDHARQLEKDQVNKFIIKQESMQERLAHFQSENLLLRQQLEDMQNKGILKEKVVNDMQDRFNDIFNKLRADTEKQVYLVEERNKELNAKCTDLREQVFKYETDKVEREGMIRQLQQELADALKKQSMSEASLEVTARYRSDLEEDKLRLQKELEKVKTKIHNRLEELMSSLQTTQAAAEDHHHQQIGELSQQLEAQSRKCKDLEAENQDLQEELSTMREKHQKLETRKCQLIEEVANLKHHLKTSMVDHNHMEQYKKEVEQRAEQEIRQKLQEVNLFLQTQAACQDRLEQIRASHHASLRKQLKYRIRDLECELDRIKNIQQDNIFQKESTQAEVERYKGLYLEEVKIRRCLANKLERANEKLAEANAHLLQERHRNKSLIASSIVSGGVAPSPVLYSNELGHLGNNLALNRSLSLGGSFLSPAESTLSSRNRVEAYVAKVRQELDEKITKDLEQATAELKTGSTGASPVGSTDGSSKNAHVDQDPLCRAIQEYRDVLTKNYRIC